MRPKYSLLVVLLIDIFAGRGSLCQEEEFRFKKLSIREGLSQSCVNVIAQDRAGFLWFGTQDGLNRYDGYTFKVFTHDPGDTTSLSNNYIWSICAARDGSLWIGTLAGGLNRFDAASGTFSSWKHNPADPRSLPSDNVTTICESGDSTLWVGTWGGGLCRMDPGRKGFSRFMQDSAVATSLSHNRVACVLEDSRGDLWVATWGGGVCRMRKEKKGAGEFVRYLHAPGNPASIGGDVVWTIHEDRRGTVWFGTQDGWLSRYNRATDDFTNLPMGKDNTAFANFRINFIHEDRYGHFWVGTWQGGLDLLDTRSGTFRHIVPDPWDYESIGGGQVASVCEDSAGALWFGTGSSGISMYDRGRQKFHTYHHRAPDPASLSGNEVTAFWQEDGKGLWVGTNRGGLDFLPEGSTVFRHHRHSRSDPLSLSSDQILCLSGREKDVLWVGTADRGLNRFDRKTGQCRPYFNDVQDTSSLANNGIVALLEDSWGELWIGTGSIGLIRMDKTRKLTRHYRFDASDTTSLSGDWIWSLFEDSRKNLWVGTWGAGLDLFDRATGKFTRFRHIPGDAGSVGNNSILCIAEDPQGTIWVGTQGGGLSRYEERSRRFRSFGRQNCLPNDVVYAILPDAHGFLWLSTNNGVARFDPTTSRCKVFDESDGLQSNEFNRGAGLIGKNGWMYLGGIAGFNVFHPDSIQENRFPPPVVMTDFKIFEQSRSIPTGKGADAVITLSPDQSFFSFEFAALSFTAPQKNQYAYKLEGFDQDWVYCGTRRYAGYTNLEGGDYTFLVKGSNNDGLWSAQPAAVRIRVTLPYWKTLWFQILIAATLAGFGFLTIQSRMNRLKKEKFAQQEFTRKLTQFQDSERKRVASALHDSLGQDLLIVKNGLHSIASRTGLPPPMQEELTGLAEGVQQAIEDTREISFDLHPHTLDSLGLRKAIISVLRKCEQSSPVCFTTDMDSIDNLFSPAEELNLFRLIQEGVNNVIKHAHAAHCTLVVRRLDGLIELTLRDDGVGFDAHSRMTAVPRRQGMGLVSMSERVNYLKGEMTLHSVPGGGTTLMFRIPVPNIPPENA
jgi:signal transduction histidine kinase/ligand-binding sensor domain-containing protein